MNLTPKPVCGSDTVTKTITILEPPRAVVTASMSNQNGCAPLTVNFNNQSTGYQLSYNWTITPATGWQYISGDMNSKEPVIQFNTAGNYTIKMKVSNVCDMDMWSTTVTVKVKPSITLPALGPFCQTASLCFNASDTKYDAGFGTISAYSWSFPGASPASSNAALPCNINYSVSAATTFTYTVSATNECGTSTTSGTFEIQVPPALTLPPSQSVCINQSPIQLNALPQNGIWMGPGVNASGLFDPASAGGPGVKTLTYKYGSGVCQASATTQITVLSLPVVEAGPDLTSCINQTSIPLSGNSPANGTWTSSGSGVIVGNNFNPSASGVNTYTLTYQVKDANGCINSDARKITVNALPTVTTTDLSYCNSPGLVPLPTANPVGGSWMGAGVSGSQFDPVAAGLGTHPLTYTYTDPVTGCSNTAVSNVTVSNPTTIFAGNDTTVCLNAGIIHLGMGVSPAGGNWTSSVGGLTGSDFDPNATGSGVFNLKYTFGTGNCMVMDTRVITVLPLPIVNAGTNKSVCVDQTSLMLNPTPAGGSWMGSTAITGNDFNPSQAGAGQFTLTYTYTDIKGCKNSDDLNIQVFSLPSVVAHDTTYCNTPGLVSLPYTNPMGGTWTGPGISNNQFNPIAAGGPNTYTAVYTYTNSNNCSNQDTAKIIVISPTSVDAGPDAAYCESETAVNLGADSTPGGGTWISTGLGLTGDIFNPKTAGPGTYTLTYSVGTGNCEVKDTRIITVYALPIVQAGPDLNACIDAMPIALNATPAGGSWSGSAGLSGNSFAPKQVTANTYKLVYSYTDIHGCINQDDINFTVNPLPEVKSGDTTYCNTPGAVTLPNASPMGGAWMGPGISNNLFNPVTAGGVNTYTAIYTFTDAKNCSNNDTIHISVISPNSVNAGPDGAYCVSETQVDLNLGASPTGGIWMSSSSGLQGTNFNPNAAGAGTHKLIYSVGKGNCEVRDTLVITVNALPIVQAGPDQKACIDAMPVALNATPAGGTWSGSTGLSGNSFAPKQVAANTYNLVYSYTDIYGCINKDDINFTVNPLPDVKSGDTTYCNTPGTVTLPHATPIGGTWMGSGISNNLFDPFSVGVGTYVGIYTFKDAENCSNSDTIGIEVISPAVVNAGKDTAFCVSVTSFDLNSDVSPKGGIWTSNGGSLTAGVFDPKSSGPGNFTLTYTYGTGNCAVKDTRSITVWPLPSVTAGVDVSTCLSSPTVQLNGTPGNGIWTSMPASGLNGINWSPTLSGVGTFVLTYTFKDANGCVNSADLNAVVHPLPVVLANDTTYCNTPGSVTLPAANPINGNWKGQGVSGFMFDPKGAGGIGTYPATYTYTDPFGCTDSINVSIKVIDPPAISAGPNDTICINTGILQLSGFIPNTGGFWTGSGIANQQSGVFDPLIAGGGIHPLIYTYGTGNCQVKDTTSITVIAVAIEAGPNRVRCLDDTPLQLDNFVPLGGVWSGPGITSASGVFNSQVAQAGTHVLYYQYNDPVLNCIFRDSITILVHPMPESDFEKPVNSCIDVQIPFLNLSQSTFMPNWSFGDGGSSTLANPIHVYTDTGTFKVTLITKNQYGCIDSTFRTIFVTRPPTAFFSTKPDSGCAVLKVDFMNASYGFQTNYNWNFGNGQKSTQYDPGTISFQQGSGDTIYIITLTAENLCAMRTWQDSIKVFPWPQVQFGTSLDTICTGESIGFSNLTLGKPEYFDWDFGNGVTSKDTFPKPVQFFTDSTYKTYTIRLIARNFCGSDTAEYPVLVKPVDVRAFFNTPSKSGCEPYSLTFTNFATIGASVSWDFGDQNTSSDPNPTHTFTQPGTYKVVQRASSGCGYDSTYTVITVLPAPKLSFTHAPQVCRNDTLAFQNTSPTPLSGTSWFFGDGDSSLLYHPKHAWKNSGLFPVKLIGVSAENGCKATANSQVNVLKLPLINFSPDLPDGCVPLTVHFSNASQAANYYEWNFGDGNTETGTNASHVYTIAGQYPVHLKGIDLNGCRGDTTLYYITAHPIPSPAFKMERDRLCGVPVQVQLQNQTPDALSFVWDFGNSQTSVQNNPSTTYVIAGDYSVQLTAKNAYGCIKILKQPFSAYSIPVADFAWDPEEGCAPLKVKFDNKSLFSTNAIWTFSDGSKDTIFSPNHRFSNAGLYSVQLVASHRDVCFDTLNQADIIWVKPSPYANFSFFENLTTPPSGMFTFTDLSIDATKWNWDFGDNSTPSSDKNPEHRYYFNGPKTVWLTVTSENGCTDDTTQIVIPTDMKGLFIPNAFTPGLPQVGEASVFQPKGVGLSSYEIEVYSPYGQLLWKSDKLNDGRPAEHWDGTFHGELMPQDVYTWKITKAVFDDGKIWPGNFDAGTGAGKKVGSVTLIR